MLTAHFMTAVQIEEPKEFSWCPRQRIIQTEDGVTSGSERLIIDKTYTSEKHFDPEETEIC